MWQSSSPTHVFIKVTWHGYAPGTYTDPAALDMLLDALPGQAVLLEGHTSSRNPGGATWNAPFTANVYRGASWANAGAAAASQVTAASQARAAKRGDRSGGIGMNWAGADACVAGQRTVPRAVRSTGCAARACYRTGCSTLTGAPVGSVAPPSAAGSSRSRTT